MNKNFLKNLVKDRRLTVNERLSGRLGYMGTAFIMIGPCFLCLLSAKQLNKTQ